MSMWALAALIWAGFAALAVGMCAMNHQDEDDEEPR